MLHCRWEIRNVVVHLLDSKVIPLEVDGLLGLCSTQCRGWKPLKDPEQTKRRRHENITIIIPYVAGISEKLKRIFNKHHIPDFKPTNMLRQKLVHLRTKHPGISRAMQFMLFTAARTAQICKHRNRNICLADYFFVVTMRLGNAA